MERTTFDIAEHKSVSLPRRSFLYVLGTGALFLGTGSIVEKMLGSSVVGEATGLGGYHLYSVSGGFPVVKPNQYELRISGLVRKPMTLSLDDLYRMNQTSIDSTFQCVTGWEVKNQVFSGVSLASLVAQSEPLSFARFLKFTSFDHVYTESLSLSQPEFHKSIVTTHMNGSTLSLGHGFPVRLFVPGNYGYKSIKWLSGIELVETDEQGYWEQYGYPVNAQIPT